MIRLKILELLSTGIPEKQDALLFATRIALKGSLTEADFLGELRSLESKRLVVGTQSNLTNIVTWSITPAGKLALAAELQ